MKVSLEHLYHYNCDSCSKWWTCADIKPTEGDIIFCPHCGCANRVESIAEYTVNEMLQVKDPQEVFDEIVKSQMEEASKEEGRELPLDMLNSIYSIFVLGEMYGTISTCLAQNIPIPKEMWDIPVVQSFVRGDVDDVVMVDELNDTIEAKMPHCGIGIINTKPLIENKGLIITP